MGREGKSARRIRVRGEITDFVTLDEEASHKVRDVLRLSAGDRIELVDDTGARRPAEIAGVDANGVWVKIVGSLDNSFRPSPVAIGIPLLKGDRMDWAIEKAVEAGVGELRIWRADRSIPKDVGAEKIARWRRIAEAAALQSGTGAGPNIPEIAPDLTALIAGRTTISHLDASGSPWREIAVGSIPDIVIVGPEGGWSDSECEILLRASSRAISIGRSIYRAESAVLIASFLAGQIATL